MNRFRLSAVGHSLCWSLGLGLVVALGGCRAEQPERVGVAPTVEPTVRPVPTARPTPHVTPKPRVPALVSAVKTKRKVFALTFDDGPDPTWTPQVLAILKKWHAPATFFMVGKMVRAHPKTGGEVKAAKFPIGNHSWSHPRSTRFAVAEVERTNAVIGKVLHLKPTLFRPPYGILSNGLAQAAQKRGMDVVVWNDQGADWDKKATAETIAAKVIKGAKPGGITLLHDGGGNRSQTVAALPHIIDGLRRRGYRFVTVDELLTVGPALHDSVLPLGKGKRHSKSKKGVVVKVGAKVKKMGQVSLNSRGEHIGTP